VRRAGAVSTHETLEGFDFTAQPGAERPLILQLGQLAWITERSDVCFLAPTDTSKTDRRTTCRNGVSWVARHERKS
jgi:hypothetical protein